MMDCSKYDGIVSTPSLGDEARRKALQDLIENGCLTSLYNHAQKSSRMDWIRNYCLLALSKFAAINTEVVDVAITLQEDEIPLDLSLDIKFLKKKAARLLFSAVEIPSSLDELIDIVYLFSSYLYRFKTLKRKIEYPRNKRTLIILWSGGFGILATDTLIEMGLEVPHFKGETLKKLTKIYPIRVGSLANPLDLPFVTYQKELVEVTKAAVDEDISLVIVETDAWKNLEGKQFKGYYKNLLEIRDYVEKQNKIMIIILHQYPSESQKIFIDMLLKDKFLVYPSLEAAAVSFLKLYEYGKKIAGHNKKIISI